MELKQENQFVAPDEVIKYLTGVFEKEYEMRNAEAVAKGGMLFDNKEAFCRKKTLEASQTIGITQAQIIAGVAAFLQNNESVSTLSSILVNMINQDQAETEKIEINDEDFLKLYNLACVELNKSNYRVAEDMFLCLNWLNPKIYFSLMNVGLAESLQGHHAEAQEIYEFCLTNFSDVPLLNFYAADNYYMMNDKEKALEYLEQSIKLANEANDQACLELAEQLRAKLS